MEFFTPRKRDRRLGQGGGGGGERGPCPSGKTRGVVVAGRRRGGFAFARRGEGGSRHRVASRRGETGELWRGKRPRRRADELSEPQGRVGAGAGRRHPGLWETGHWRSRGAMARRGGWSKAVERLAVLRPDVFGNSDPGACSGSPWRRPERSRLRMANGGDPNSCGDRRRAARSGTRAASWSGFTPTRNRSLAFATGSTTP